MGQAKRPTKRVNSEGYGDERVSNKPKDSECCRVVALRTENEGGGILLSMHESRVGREDDWNGRIEKTLFALLAGV